MSIYSTNRHIINTWEANQILEREKGKTVRAPEPYGGPSFKNYTPRLPQLHVDGTTTMSGDLPLAS